MSNRPPIPAMPPLSSIEDKNTRVAIQAIVDGLRVRNGEVGDGEHKFLTAKDLKDAVGGTTVNVFGGGAYSSSGSLGSGGKQNPINSIVSDMIKKVSDEITNSRWYKHLSERIAVLDTPEWFQEKFGSAIKEEEIKRDSADQAMFSKVTRVISVYDGSIAQIQQDLTTQATATSANASAITTLQTSVGSATTTANQAFTLASSANGAVTGGWSVKFDVNGYVTGFGLGVDASSGTATSSFIVKADRFAVGAPGSTSILPFTISGGNVYITSAVLKNSLTQTGTVTVGISSANYAYHSAGWSLDATTGAAEFTSCVFNSTIQAATYNGSYGWSITNAGDTNFASVVCRGGASVGNGLSVSNGLSITGGISLNGSYITSWPSGGGGSYPTDPSFSSVCMYGSIYASGSGYGSGWTIGSAGHARFAGGVTAEGGFANFTGVHYGLSTDITDWQQGDILVDVTPVYAAGVSNVTFEVERSSTANDKKAIGIFSGMGNVLDSGIPSPIDLAAYELVHINSVGEGQMWVCGEAGDIEAGDLIVTSNTAGKGMRQADDLIRSATVGRARESVTFSTPSECKLIAAVYMCG